MKSTMIKILLTFCLFIIGLLQPASAKPMLTGKSEGVGFQVEKVVEGLGIPWGMTFISSTEILITERTGSIKLINVTTGKTTGIKGGPVVMASGQGGLLDVAVPKGYESGDWIYFTYTKELDEEGATTLARGKLSGRALTDWNDLLITKSMTGTTRHFGSRIAFDGKGGTSFFL